MNFWSRFIRNYPTASLLTEIVIVLGWGWCVYGGILAVSQ